MAHGNSTGTDPALMTLWLAFCANVVDRGDPPCRADGTMISLGANMVGYLALVVLQFVAAFLGAPVALRYVPVQGDPRTFVHAALFAVIVWIVGLVGSFALKDVRLPTTRTLAAALVGAFIGAALMFVPQLLAAIPLKFPPLYLPLAGAILGYLVRR